MFDFSFNEAATITTVFVGNEKTPLVIIDNFVNAPEDFVEFSGDGSGFSSDSKNFYPGKRKLTPESYGEQLSHNYFELLVSSFGLTGAVSAKTKLSALAISDLPVNQLRPMQMVPHIDTVVNNQFAVVHYLCGEEHGGTSFYRHKSTGFEVITKPLLFDYGSQLKKEAIEQQIHLQPRYMSGSNQMFELTYTVKAKFNRAIIYPSNLLHSGNINPELGLSSSPKNGRLTVTSLVLCN